MALSSREKPQVEVVEEIFQAPMEIIA